MSFREKSAWISFLSILLIFGYYFGRLFSHLATFQDEGMQFVPLFLFSVAALVVIEVVGHIAIALHTPKEARTPKDERERLIVLKATRIAFMVLVIGEIFAAILIMHHGAVGTGRWFFANTVLSFVVFAELVKFAAQIVYHRRGV